MREGEGPFVQKGATQPRVPETGSPCPGFKNPFSFEVPGGAIRLTEGHDMVDRGKAPSGVSRILRDPVNCPGHGHSSVTPDASQEGDSSDGTGLASSMTSGVRQEPVPSPEKKNDRMEPDICSEGERIRGNYTSGVSGLQLPAHFTTEGVSARYCLTLSAMVDNFS